MLILIISAILFHLPLAFYKDTARRFQRMQQFNPEEAIIYETENNIPFALSGSGQSPFANQLFFYISGISSFIFALIPLFFALDIHWTIIIIGNILASLFVIPFLAFVIYSFNTIMSVRLLKTITIICIILGSIFFVIGL